MSEPEKLRKQIARLEARAGSLEKRLDRILGKMDGYTPRSTAIARTGLPLEIFTRLALIEADYVVHGAYPFLYHSIGREPLERSIDIYASRDSTYVTPDGASPRAAKSREERDHLLVEVKQRRPGVEWIFCGLPKSSKDRNSLGDGVPTVNAGFELRPGDSGIKPDPNENSVNNAIAQLNQAYTPFEIARETGGYIEAPGSSHRISAPNRADCTRLLLVTNAKLKFFEVPIDLDAFLSGDVADESVFKDVPWVSYHPESTISLRYHQERSCAVASWDNADARERSTARMMIPYGHEVDIVDRDRLSEYLECVKDPPRIERISFSMTIDGGPESKFDLDI